MKKILSPNLVKIIKILSDRDYHDGTAIGKRLQMTRSAVWKLIKKLEQYGVKIDSIKGKGYALQEPIILLDAAQIKKNLSEPIRDILVFETIESTSDYLKSFKQADKIKVCLAEEQTKGRGRLHRSWYSPFGKNVYLSCLYPFQKDLSELAGLSLVTGLAIAKTLKEFGVEDVTVKWPNDIVVKNKKISGTLIDLQGESHGKSLAIIGIGLDVNMLDDDGEIPQPWTSMRKELGDYVDRNMLCAHLLNNLMQQLQQFDAEGLTVFVDEWMQSDHLMNATVALKNAGQQVTGKVMGINAQGHLLLRLANGSVRAFSSGDTSVVK